VTVVIVGGGPVGLVASIALSDLGVDNVVVERDVAVYGLPRAIVMDAEVRAALARLGLGARLDEILHPMRAADFVDANGNTVTGIDLDGIEIFGYPAVSKHFQPMLDAMLRDEAQRRGAQLVLGRSVVAHRATSEGVVVELDDGKQIRGQYLVACDGASSRTRKAQGIGLDDLGFDQDWLVVDVLLNDRATAGLPDVTRQVCDPRRPTTLVSGFGDYYRFEFQLQPGENPQMMTEDGAVWSLLHPYIDQSRAKLVRRASYRFHAVVAERMHDGRVLLAGDSAHQMPPFMGQGLNSGMRDALNLAWKLAYVQRGWCDRALLDTYSTERIPVTRAVVQQSVDTGRLVDQIAGRESHGVNMSAGYGGERLTNAYTDGVLVLGAPQVGTPYPFFHLHANQAHDAFLVIGAPAHLLPGALGAIPLVSVYSDRLAAQGHDHVVVRPDGYVAAGSSTDGLDNVLATLRARLCVKGDESAAKSPHR